ncbi:low molecular weight protein-tyrosine-phosphatase [Wenzhouxiangella sp. XN24]|uniref:low molecular weight protein-tyrosine-phosphatase n=1 Tax=Wenzhouxiangella sp. XN24 TaxID=2713569 RepID=UPI0013EA2DF4|nr:low molecular weight protein-tyrosine-phosphatase [Wenzhouxiangella sp. XN24]NGX16714.1 low molecular weight phosphotyrosine protein phosphatase [Wenzhouxiangella sp. XN24]
MAAEEDCVKFSVLFVCLGNICRSPTAEAVFRKLAADAGLAERIHIDSAGTIGFHHGAPPDGRAAAAALARGFDLGSLRARRVVAEDFARFDLILAMDEDNLADLERIRPDDARARLALLLEYGGDSGTKGVPDPYYGGKNGFEQVLDLVTAACAGLVEDVRRTLR